MKPLNENKWEKGKREMRFIRFSPSDASMRKLTVQRWGIKRDDR